MGSLRYSGDSIEGQTKMHEQMLYRCFRRAWSLCSDRALGRYVATERSTCLVAAQRSFSSSCPMIRVSSAKLFVKKNLFRKSIRRRRFFSFSSSGIWMLTSSQPFSTPTVSPPARQSRDSSERIDDFSKVKRFGRSSYFKFRGRKVIETVCSLKI